MVHWKALSSYSLLSHPTVALASHTAIVLIFALQPPYPPPCSVFYEGQHDDSRTNLAIAQSAAMHGADILNYADVVEFLKDEEGRLVGAIVEDGVGGERLTVKAKSGKFRGGSYRAMGILLYTGGVLFYVESCIR